MPELIVNKVRLATLVEKESGTGVLISFFEIIKPFLLNYLRATTSEDIIIRKISLDFKDIIIQPSGVSHFDL